MQLSASKSAVAAALAASFLILRSSAPAGADFPPYAKVVSIVVVAPLSGTEKQFGIDISNGVQEAIDETNDARGIADYGWVMHSFDDQSDPGIAQQQAQFALVDPSTAFIVGHVGGQETALALPTYHQAEVPVIIPTSPYAALTQTGYDNVFRLCPTDVSEGRNDARYADRTLGAKRIAVIYEQNDYGADAGQGFVNYTSARNITEKDFPIDVEFKDLKAQVAAVKDWAPDLIFMSGNGADMSKVVPALRTAGVTTPLLSTQGFYNDSLLKAMGDNAEGITVSSCVPPVQFMPTVNDFVSRYQGRYGKLSAFGLFGYVAGQIAIQSTKLARSTDHRAIDRALATGTFNTILGQMQFQPSGDLLGADVYFYQYKKGAFNYVAAAYPNPLIVH
ncbi:MAG TPA: branched-chain amino acid ABC transporter substrate-binding protein [Candidatus Eremiobacteraceae bacterium]|nr:branched-chain amino acid ABC transporter substrate-binding protein [Candidatus Eremiobacteraceae bacterium]